PWRCAVLQVIDGIIVASSSIRRRRVAWHAGSRYGAAMRAVVMTLYIVGWATIAQGAPPEPTGPHPRILLDSRLRAAWQERKDGRNPIAGAILLCGGDQGREHAGAQYMG